MKPKSGWFWFWMLWLSTFVVAETIAILDRDLGDTLSESIWFLQRSWWPLTVLLIVLFGFLIWHFIWDKRSRKRKEDDEQPQQKSKRDGLPSEEAGEGPTKD